MAEVLTTFLRKRADQSLAYLLREAEAVDSGEAFRDRRDNWPDQRWGIGQDGSIAGILYHTAAWKQLTLPLFALDGQAGSRADFEPSTAPDRDDWPAIVDWLRRVGAEWNAQLAAADLDAIREWEGARLTLADYAVEMIQHDVQHAAQIEYLRQLHKS